MGCVNMKPVLASEQYAKRCCDLSVTIALAPWWECPRIAERIAPQLDKFFEFIDAFDGRLGDHGVGLRLPQRRRQLNQWSKPSTACVSSHLAFLNRIRSDKAICRC
jgi:hypothetical protein